MENSENGETLHTEMNITETNIRQAVENVKKSSNDNETETKNIADVLLSNKTETLVETPVIPPLEDSEDKLVLKPQVSEAVKPRIPKVDEAEVKSGTETKEIDDGASLTNGTVDAEDVARSKNDDILPSIGILPEEDSPIICTFRKKIESPKEIKDLLDTSSSSDVSSRKVTNPSNFCPPSEIAHKVKRIKWKDIEVPVITQNNNGPCPLLAILNAMLLKGNITLPSDRQELTGGELVLVVANAVFDVPRTSVPKEMHRCLEQNSQDAVNILDKLLTGLDVNIKFSGVRDFEFTPELSIFDVLGISLYHGWVIDPEHEAASLVSTMSYNQLTNNIISWREEATTNGDDSLLVKAILCEQFIDNSVSQLTYQGLYDLGASLAEDEIAVLFRNNHFSTIYKKSGTLYLLLTDQGYLHTNAVWETFTDVDSTFTEFVNGAFQVIQPSDTIQTDTSNMTTEQQINSDLELATMLQEEDQKVAQREDDVNKMLKELGLKDLPDEEIALRLQERENQLAEEASRSQLEQQQQQQQEASISSRTSQPCKTSPQPKSSQEPPEKKKKECIIL